jgi:hypothetical protein
MLEALRTAIWVPKCRLHDRPAAAQQAELVALRVGEHMPARLSVCPTSTGRTPSSNSRSRSAAWSRSLGLTSMCRRSFSCFSAATGANRSVGSVPSPRPISTAPSSSRPMMGDSPDSSRFLLDAFHHFFLGSWFSAADARRR